MDAFVSRKRRRLSPPPPPQATARVREETESVTKLFRDHEEEDEEESTDVKLAILSSLHAERAQSDLLEVLLGCEGSVQLAKNWLAATNNDTPSPSALSPAKRRQLKTPATQVALPFAVGDNKNLSKKSNISSRPLTRKGKTLHLYTAADIAEHTPCSIVHNFLPRDLAHALLQELLSETPTFESISFKIFDNVVKSPHTACFYVDSLEALQQQRSEYYYNGNDLGDIRQILPVMRQVSDLVRDAVNDEVATRIRDFYPNGEKLQYQSPDTWQPNAAFVNCYDGGAQHVGYHSDQLSYLGPRAIIGSLSLGVEREFRVRKIVPKDDDADDEKPEKTEGGSFVPAATAATAATADISGQIAIHLPHNSLLVMHAEMQEEWKHSIAPAPTVTPHPVAGNKRINITYRHYREEFRPKYTPKCRCGVPCVLKTVQKQKVNRGRYMWMCQVGNKPDERLEGGGQGCGWFEWARFTDGGIPVGWKGGEASNSRLQNDDNI
jgi:alkylated DNA repair dioxygenase AlkB